MAVSLPALMAGDAATPDKSAGAVFFKDRVQPLLAAHCWSCHSHAAKKSKGGLVLDSRDSVLKGGDSGPAVELGQAPQASLLVKAITHDPDISAMPPKGKLPDEAIAVLSEWVARGIPFPEQAASAGAKKTSRPRGQITEEDRQWWAFQPRWAGQPPVVTDPAWAANPIDRFVKARLDAEGLTPSPPVSRAVLIRRLTFDLTGLPPTPAEVAAFVADPADDTTAINRVVDRLLTSRAHAERQAQLWLDLVRYAESDGFRIDEYRPTAWRYRDYVVNSLAADKPYNRFVAEQLAGDELFSDDPQALAGTGFLRLGIYEYNNRDVRSQWDNMLNEITDVVGDVFLGLGMSCARCHDHKFDPILQRDYYRLQAFFAAVDMRDDVPLATAAQRAAHQAAMTPWLVKTADVRAKLEALEAPVRAEQARKAIAKFPLDIQAILAKPEDQRDPLERQLGALAYRQVDFEFHRLDRYLKGETKDKILALRRELANLSADKPAPLPVTQTVTDLGLQAAAVRIPKRGAAEIEPGYLTVFGEAPATIAAVPHQTTTRRRATLATWLTDPANPLTARVMVNRLWQQHFGQGLVTTASDFGRLGDRPSHPELLDWLANEFVANAWSLRAMHRLMVTSMTYRQSVPAAAPVAALTQDPENRLLWRGQIRRLDAEQIRDAILVATGQLQTATGGPSVDWGTPRRSLYLKVYRNSREPLLDVFDVSDHTSSTPARNVTTTPTQALLMINGPYLQQQAATLAQRLWQTHGGDTSAMVTAVHQTLFGRPPTDEDRTLAQDFLDAQAARFRPSREVMAAAHVQQEKIPFRDGRAMVVTPASNGMAPQLRLPTDTHPDLAAKLPTGAFTVEAFMVLRSLYDTAAVRPLITHWSGRKTDPGWALGVTSKRSAYKPQTLVLQVWGPGRSPTGEALAADYQPLFSDLHIDLDKPYFVAVSVAPLPTTTPAGSVTVAASRTPPGLTVTFYAKDLSNDDEPVQIQSLTSRLTTCVAPTTAPLVIGGESFANGVATPAGKSSRTWDGLLDDIRFSRGALPVEQLLLTQEGPTERTVAYWQFEPRPGPLADSSPNALHLLLSQVAAMPGGVTDVSGKAGAGKASAGKAGTPAKSDAAKSAPATGNTAKAEKSKPGSWAENPRMAAFVDYCHVLLNTSEFVYLD